ncbi:hypothetical protein GCG54_00013038 [Colletotrichum gloeosporioides]|uniref:Uncharacterized protein n=3 Tax=Colletotrichum gloeosporioides species complex TaxID=2707338 RepID=T0KES7_COLGC|nr:uncharacterized protein GCG54_00013038 [Colletotrichum gloeosporioides]EQB50624.1 hypothetical protein CGLO_09919 [Colletotrichum gloeosporioides Cg-14]KAF3808399.1 hypothetical protein GCG54_00013038 [Colletotrichum gloeosporioides]
MPSSSRPAKIHYSSSSSSDSDLSSASSSYRQSMDSVARPIASVEVLRCLRCARSVEATSTDDSSSTGMVRIAHNLYYCERCAKMVGLNCPRRKTGQTITRTTTDQGRHAKAVSTTIGGHDSARV